MPDCWHGTDAWFNKRVMREPEGRFVEFYGLVKPILHLNE